jgi:hypothetical protein
MVLPIQFDGGRIVDVRNGSTVIEASQRNAVLWKAASASGGSVGAAIAGLAFARERIRRAAARPLRRDRRQRHRGIPPIIRGTNLISDANLATRLSRGYSQST